MAKEDLAVLAKREYDELAKQKTDLQAQMAEIDKKIKPLTAYLQATGALKVSKRGRKPKVAAEVKA